METQGTRIRDPDHEEGPERSELTITTASPVSASTRSVRWLIAPAAIFAAVALTAGLLARGRQEHQGNFTLFFSSQFHQIAEGVPVTQLAAQLGHAKKSMTLDVYSHVLLYEAP